MAGVRCSGRSRPACVASAPTTSTCCGCTSRTSSHPSTKSFVPSTISRAAGKILYAGLSNFPAWMTPACRNAGRAPRQDSDRRVQFEYSLVERSADRETFPMAEALGLGAALWSPLGGGLLSGKYRHGNRRQTDRWKRLVHTEDDAAKAATVDAVSPLRSSSACPPRRWRSRGCWNGLVARRQVWCRSSARALSSSSTSYVKALHLASTGHGDLRTTSAGSAVSSRSAAQCQTPRGAPTTLGGDGFRRRDSAWAPRAPSDTRGLCQPGRLEGDAVPAVQRRAPSRSAWPSVSSERRFSSSIGMAVVDSSRAASRGDGNAVSIRSTGRRRTAHPFPGSPRTTMSSGRTVPVNRLKRHLGQVTCFPARSADRRRATHARDA